MKLIIIVITFILFFTSSCRISMKTYVEKEITIIVNKKSKRIKNGDNKNK